MTTIEDISTLLSSYTSWLSNSTVLQAVDNSWVQVTTPWLDRHNDFLQIYILKQGNSYLLSDDSYILNDLENSGCNLDGPKLQGMLHTTLAGFGVNLRGNELQVNATRETFSVRKHNLIQAMLAVNDMFYLASPFTASLFYEDVSQWLDDQNIRNTPKIKLAGKSGYDHMFDFVIPKSKQGPERFIQTINNPKKDSAKALLFAWMDTRQTRSQDTQLYAFLNDKNQPVAQAVLDAMKQYDLRPVLWEQRSQIQDQLLA